jgi:hypothetical protein
VEDEVKLFEISLQIAEFGKEGKFGMVWKIRRG